MTKYLAIAFVIFLILSVALQGNSAESRIEKQCKGMPEPAFTLCESKVRSESPW